MKQTPIIFGEVLFDHFPDGATVLGGAPFNVAWHLQAFGANPLLITKVGDDPLGRTIRQEMQAWGMNTAGLQLDSSHPTGTVQVRYESDGPHFDIVDQRAYDFIDQDALPPTPDAALLYHGSLALRSDRNQQTLAWLKEQYPVPAFVDINLRPPWWDKRQIQGLLNHARWIKLNESELATLVPDAKDRNSGVQLLQKRYQFEYLFLTLGEAGACAYDANGAVFEVKPERHDKVIDTVGAGDAFSSVLLLGLLNNWPIELMMPRAQSFASRLVQHQGAIVTEQSFYQSFAEAWGLT